jgi:uncharacterized protein
MANIHHAIDYVELPVRDLTATRTFYERAFGWQFNDHGPEYARIVAPGGDREVIKGSYDFPGGRRFHFEDPSGNELGVWASG